MSLAEDIYPFTGKYLAGGDFLRINTEHGLSFDDVLLVPKRNAFGSRMNVELRSNLTKRIVLNVPIVSANMDTITESRLAIVMAQNGGIGIIHRFNSIEEEANEVRKVKRQNSYIIREPYTLSPNMSVGQARELSRRYGVSGFPVVEGKKLVGIITNRDFWFSGDGEIVEKVMTRKKDMVFVEQDKIKEYGDFEGMFRKKKVEKVPIVDSKGNLTGMVTVKDVMNMKDSHATKSKDGTLMVGAAIGVKDAVERAKALLDAGADALVIDIAHGHSDAVVDTIKKIKKNFDAELIAGNVATYEGADELMSAGADAVKVGIGPGSVCTTRIVTGSGIPQLTAIGWAYKAAEEHGIPIIADGGIRNSGDMAKAIAAGASTVMIGRMLAGTEESPGSTIMKDGKKYKFYRGMSSISANSKKLEIDSSDFGLSDVVGEGNETFVPYVGSARDVIVQIAGGLRSAFSYSGSRNIEELRKNAELIRISPSAKRESYSKLD